MSKSFGDRVYQYVDFSLYLKSREDRKSCVLCVDTDSLGERGASKEIKNYKLRTKKNDEREKKIQ